jgi:hypothetical protein
VQGGAGESEQGNAGRVVQTGHGNTRQDIARLGEQGRAVQVKASQGKARQSRQGRAEQGVQGVAG